MKLQIDKNELLRIITYANNVILNKVSISILLNIILETQKDSLCVKGTDLKAGVITNSPAYIEKEGSICVNSKKFLDIIKSFDSQSNVVLEVIDSKLVITSDNPEIHTKFNLNYLSVNDYPKVESIKSDKSFYINEILLKNLLLKVEYCKSLEGERHFLNGVYFSIDEKYSRFVSTDGRRLSYIDNVVDEGVSIDNFNEIIPGNTLKVLLPMLNSDEDCIIQYKGDYDNVSQVSFKTQSGEIVSNMLEGKFPRYNQVIPKSAEHEIVCNRLDLLRAIGRVRNFAGKTFQVHLSITKDKMIIYSEDVDSGNARDIVDIKNVDGNEIEISINCEFMYQSVNRIDENDITIGYSKVDSPILITGVDNDSYKNVIMPMKQECDE